MDKKIKEALFIIQEFRDKELLPEYNSLKKEGFDKNLLNSMRNEGLIKWAGVFSLTDKGEKILQNYLLIRKKEKKNFIFDSNIFDKIASGDLKIEELIKFKKKAEFHITHIQVDEINKCTNIEKRSKLFLFMTKLAPKIIPTNSFILGKSRLGEARLSDGIIFEKLKNGNDKNTGDALIGETAIKEKLILITEDKNLRKKVNLQGGKSLSLEEFKTLIKT
jgi:rRNA-processing protein FCF1